MQAPMQKPIRKGMPRVAKSRTQLMFKVHYRLQRVTKLSQYLLPFELNGSHQHQKMKRCWPRKMKRIVIGTSGSTSTSAYTTKSVSPVSNPQQDKLSSKFSKNMKSYNTTNYKYSERKTKTAIPHTNKRSHDSNWQKLHEVGKLHSDRNKKGNTRSKSFHFRTNFFLEKQEQME